MVDLKLLCLLITIEIDSPSYRGASLARFFNKFLKNLFKESKQVPLNDHFGRHKYSALENILGAFSLFFAR